jgi:hypothetical protein
MTKDYSVREAVGIFDGYDQMEKTIEALQRDGFGRHQISVLGSEAAVKEKFGARHVKTELVEDHPDAPRSPNIKKEELRLAQGLPVGGGLLTGVVAAVIMSGGGVAVPGIVTTAVVTGAGGTVVGAYLAKLLGDKYAEFFQNQINQGGLLLWINTPNMAMEAKAIAILKQHGARDVHELVVNTDIESSAYSSYVFSEAFVKLDQIVEAHKTIILGDSMMKNKLSNLLESLKNTATRGNNVSQEQAQVITKQIDDAISYAKDMAEEEQRLIAETLAKGTGKQEKESERYFALAHDLGKFVADYLSP